MKYEFCGTVYGEGKYDNEFEQDSPSIKQFLTKFNKYADDISVDGETVNSHTLKTTVEVTCVNCDESYKIVALEVDRLMGCGCSSGIRILVAKEE